MPLSPLEYSVPLQSGRPGIVTAIGVMSIVVACLTGLACLWWVLMSLGFLMMSTVRMPVIPPPATNPSSVVPAGGSVTVGGIAMQSVDDSDGLAPAPRKVTSDLLARMGSLDATRQKHVDLLLAVAGQKMFPSPGGPLTTQSIRRNISDFGVIPSSTGGKGTVFFVIGTGRIEVYDDHAIFRPDGSSDVVSASAPADSDNSSSAAPLPPKAPPNANWNSSWVTSGGKTTVTTTVNGRTSTTTYSGAPPKTVTPMPFPFKINPIPAGMLLGESVLSLGLAIYLLVAGIMVLRNSLSGRKLHWIYVAIKIPLVILAIAASVWMWSEFFNSMSSAISSSSGAAPKASFGSVIIIWAIVGGVIALAYPVALIFALSSRTVRDYYNAVRA
jgi:hypothetical protein